MEFGIACNRFFNINEINDLLVLEVNKYKNSNIQSYIREKNFNILNELNICNLIFKFLSNNKVNKKYKSYINLKKISKINIDSFNVDSFNVYSFNVSNMYYLVNIDNNYIILDDLIFNNNHPYFEKMVEQKIFKNDVGFSCSLRIYNLFHYYYSLKTYNTLFKFLGNCKLIFGYLNNSNFIFKNNYYCINDLDNMLDLNFNNYNNIDDVINTIKKYFDCFDNILREKLIPFQFFILYYIEINNIDVLSYCNSFELAEYYCKNYCWFLNYFSNDYKTQFKEQLTIILKKLVNIEKTNIFYIILSNISNNCINFNYCVLSIYYLELLFKIFRFVDDFDIGNDGSDNNDVIIFKKLIVLLMDNLHPDLNFVCINDFEEKITKIMDFI